MIIFRKEWLDWIERKKENFESFNTKKIKLCILMIIIISFILNLYLIKSMAEYDAINLIVGGPSNYELNFTPTDKDIDFYKKPMILVRVYEGNYYFLIKNESPSGSVPLYAIPISRIKNATIMINETNDVLADFSPFKR